MALTRETAGDAEANTPAVSKAFLATMNTIQTARNIVSRALGFSFNGLRNLYQTFGYEDVVTYEQMLARFGRQDIVSRIASAYPDAVWARPPAITKNDGLKWDIAALDKHPINLYAKINRADTLASMGKFAVLVLGFDDIRSSEQMKLPLQRTRTLRRTSETDEKLAAGKLNKLLYVTPYGYGSVQIASMEDDASSPYFGQPKTYTITTAMTENGRAVPVDGNSARTAKGVKLEVHRDRVVHICEKALDNDLYGYPIVERVYNRLDDIEKTVGGSAEMFWLSGRNGMQLDVDKDVDMTTEDAEKLRKEVDDFHNDLRRTLRTRGVNLKELGGRNINPEPVFNVIMSIISIATGIPQRIFIGSEQGKLASEQDRANWAIRVNDRRYLHAEPNVLFPLIAKLQYAGCVTQGEYILEWPEAFQMSPLERAQTAAQQARSAVNVVRADLDWRKPVEGADFSIRRPTQQFTSGGGGGFGKNLIAHIAALAANDSAGAKPAAKPGAAKPAAPAPKPIEIEQEEILVKKPPILSVKEIRSIIFCRGELKGEAEIDNVRD